MLQGFSVDIHTAIERSTRAKENLLTEQPWAVPQW